MIPNIRKSDRNDSSVRAVAARSSTGPTFFNAAMDKFLPTSSPDMRRRIINSEFGLDTFSLRILLCWLGFQYIQSKTSSDPNPAASSTDTSGESVKRIETLMAEFLRYFACNVLSGPLIRYIQELEEVLGGSMSSSVSQLLKSIRENVENAPDRRIIMSQEEARSWATIPLAEMKEWKEGSRIESRHVSECLQKALQRYQYIIPNVTDQFHTFSLEIENDRAKEVALLSRMKEIGQELTATFQVDEDEQSCLKTMFTDVSHKIAEKCLAHREMNADFMQQVIKPTLQHLSRRHLSAIRKSTSNLSLEKHAVEFKEGLKKVCSFIDDFGDATHPVAKEITALLLKQYAIFFMFLSNDGKGNRNASDIDRMFDECMEGYRMGIDDVDNPLRHECMQLLSTNPQQTELFAQFTNCCDELMQHYRYRREKLGIWSNVFAVAMVTLASLNPKPLKASPATAQSIDPEAAAKAKAIGDALIAEASKKPTSPRRGGKGKRTAGRGRGERHVSSASGSRSEEPSSSVSISSSTSASIVASAESKAPHGPRAVYEKTYDDILSAFESWKVDGATLTPAQKATNSSKTHIVDALLELRDLPKISNAEALADHLNTLLYAVSLASEQALYCRVLETKGIVSPYQALRYADHNQKWLLSQLGEVSPESHIRVGEVDRLEFYVRSLYSKSTSKRAPKALSLLHRAENLRKGRLTHDDARTLVEDVYELVRNQLSWSSGLLNGELPAALPRIDKNLIRVVMNPETHMRLPESSQIDLEHILSGEIRSKISPELWQNNTALSPSSETFYADAERALSMVLSRTRRQGSLRNHIKQTIRGKAQFLLHLGIAKQCERDPSSANTPLWMFSHNMWEYIYSAGMNEANFTPEEGDEIYATLKANTSVRYHPLFETSTGSIPNMVELCNGLNKECLSTGHSQSDFTVALSPSEQRMAGSLQRRCSAALQACLKVGNKLLTAPNPDPSPAALATIISSLSR